MSPPPRAEVRAELAVVIVSHNTRGALLACLRSLAANARLPLEIVIVDNASADGSLEAVRAVHPSVHVLANATNEGFAHGANQGLRASHAPFVLFLNSDAEITPGSLEALIARARAGDDIGIVGPRLRDGEGVIEVSTGPVLTPFAEWLQRRLVRGVARRRPRALREAEKLHAREAEPAWVSGACLLARREALDAVGGFDEGFFLYEEDADLCLRVRAARWRIVFSPAAEVLHRRGESTAGAPRRARLEYDRSHLRYYAKHNGPLATLGLRTLLAARAGAAFVRGLLRGDAEERTDAVARARLAWARGARSHDRA